MFKQSPKPQIKGTKEAREPEKEGLVVPGRGYENEQPAIVLASESDDEVSASAGPGWSWANPCATPYTTGTYLQRHPTRHVSCGGWRSKTEIAATALMNNFWGYISTNTYYDHPEGYWYDNRSIDVWGWNSRGLYLPTTTGWQVWDYIWATWPNSIQYVIYKRYYYSAANNWIGVAWGYDSFTWHDDHMHITFTL